MPILFKQTKALVAQVDQFLDAVAEGALVFEQGVHDYVAGERVRFAERYAAIDKLEKRADALRRDIEQQLYSHSLIPESRGDVLGLLETMDDVLDTAKHTLGLFVVERPELLPGMDGDWSALASTAARTTEAVVLSVRAYFRDPRTVKDHLHKVHFHEKEGDTRAMALKRRIFDSDVDLARKIHLRYFALNIDLVSDAAESVGDRLSIYAIKRTV
jgi:hypothetical protein